MVNVVMDIVVDWLMSNMVVIVVSDIVVGIDVVSSLSDMRSRVVVMVVSSDDWINRVLLSVLMLRGMRRFVVFSWPIVSVSWLSVGMLVNINNWVMVWVMWVVRIDSWIGVDSLIVVVNSFVVNWLNLVAGVLFEIMRDSLVWNRDIPFRSVVMMVIIVVSIVVIIVMVVGVLEGDLSVLIIMMEGAVLDFVISFVVHELMSYSVMFSLTTLNMRRNFVDACLLERSMV